MTEQTTDQAPEKTSFAIANFGDPEPVLDARSIFEYGYCPQWSDWYDYPFDIVAVQKLFRATSHHASAIITKKNVLTSLFQPNKYLTRREFEALVINLLVFNNGYLKIVPNKLGGLHHLKSKLALSIRRKRDTDNYVSINHQLKSEPIELLHIYGPDISQEIYGVPDYLSATNSILLNESATLFRRKYYKNGAHAGYILYMSDALQTTEDADKLEEAIENSKGAGNFKNLFMYVPNGKPDGIKVIPLAEVAAKDEFMNIKKSSRDDQLAAHRVPPQLMGMVPQSKSGFGDVKKAAEVFYEHEIVPLQNMLLDINDMLGKPVVQFSEYSLSTTT